MILLKSEKELAIMEEGGKKLARIFKKVFSEIKPGVKLCDLEFLANKLIAENNGQPSFKMVAGYNWATCININQGVVHGIPTAYRIKDGDLVSLDMGMYYRGFHSDMSRTLHLGVANDDFVEAGRRAFKKAVVQARPGNYLGQISQAIEKEITGSGYRPVEALTGHGIGRNLHEEPQIFGFLKGEVEKTPILKSGMALAIEVIYVQGKPDLVIRDDGWTIETEDNHLAGLFEDTVILTPKGPKVITDFRL